MYNITINQNCSEEEYIAIVMSLANILDTKFENINIKPLRRTGVNVPTWALLSRHERFENKI